jgi:hypothetical protein
MPLARLFAHALALIGCLSVFTFAANASSGAILTVRSGETQVVFTRGDLEGLPQTRFRTSTPWTQGIAEFEGVSFADLIKSLSGRFSKVKATALNDYSATMNVADILNDGLLAYRFNGEAMTVRNKGPLWIVFPFDANPELKSERFYSKSVWQLKSLEFFD